MRRRWKSGAKVYLRTEGEFKGTDGQGHVRTRAWFDQLGRQWAQDYDLIELEESSGDVAQVIVLNDAAIVACKAMAAEEFLASLAPSRPAGPKP